MSFMFKATVATACMTLLFATSILTRDRADTGWNPQRAQSAQSTKVRASTNKELNRETENACGDKRDSPGLPDCYATVLKQPDLADGPSAKRLSSSRNARQASGGAAPSDVQVTGSVRPVAVPAEVKVTPIRAVKAVTARSTSAQPDPAPAVGQEPAPKPAQDPVQFGLADRS
jgi:hypothetical protein